MDNAVFVCPLYDMKNHFELALNLYKSKLEHGIDSDLIFIFSNEEQKNRFELLVSENCDGEKLKYAILPAEMDQYTAKAVTKKIYGLEKYMNDYDYIILVDCEACFIKNFDAGELAKKIWDSRSMLAANLSPDGFFIMRNCYKAMGLYYNKKLRKALGTYKYNFWFNELQVYKCEYLHGFFTWLEKFDKAKIFNTWDCFEYYVFFAYLCLEHDFGIRKYPYLCMGGINEYLDIFNIKKQRKILKKMNVHWTSSMEAVSDDTVMLFHLDRSKQTGGYGYNHIWRNMMRFIIKRYLCLIKELPQNIRNQ